ncbi:MAG: hypothetical protein NC453_20540 [Muribaculum sp.]|nr:hypothetical protein [Muribaculum sp.]
MSKIVRYRNGRVVEYWDDSDIAEYLNIPMHKAERIHMLANKEYDVVGYGSIDKEDFIEFVCKVEAAKESQRLADEANAAAILYAQKNYSFGRFSFFVSQAISLLTNH